MMTVIYRDASGRINHLRKKDLQLLVERYNDPVWRIRVGERTAKVIDTCVTADLEYLLRGGRIA
jgi:hypothetical protein